MTSPNAIHQSKALFLSSSELQKEHSARAGPGCGCAQQSRKESGSQLILGFGRVWFSFRWATGRPAILPLRWLTVFPPPDINSAFAYPILPTIQHKPRLCPMDRDKNTNRRESSREDDGSVYSWWSPATGNERAFDKSVRANRTGGQLPTICSWGTGQRSHLTMWDLLQDEQTCPWQQRSVSHSFRNKQQIRNGVILLSFPAQICHETLKQSLLVPLLFIHKMSILIPWEEGRRLQSWHDFGTQRN